MGRFPENERAIFDDYLPGNLQQLLVGARNHLVVASVPSPEAVVQTAGFPVSNDAGQRRAVAVDGARSALLSALQGAHLVGNLPLDETTDLGLLRAANALMKANEWAAARTKFTAIRDRGSRLQVPDFAAFVDAFRPEDLDYEDIEMVFDRPDDATPRQIILVFKTLPGFPTQHRPGDAERAEIYRCLEFLAAGTIERDFRLDACDVECGMALAATDEELRSAVAQVEGVLNRLPKERVDDRKRVALRHAAGLLAVGDRAFRGVRAPSQAPSEMRDLFLSVTLRTGDAELGIHPENPERVALERAAELQLEKISAGLNVLGFQEGYVPPNEAKILRQLALDRAASAKLAVADFVKYKERGQELQAAIADLDFQRKVTEQSLQIDDRKLANARDQISIASTQEQDTQNQIAAHDWGFGLDLGLTVIKAVAGIHSAGGVVVNAGTAKDAVGVAGMVTGYLAQRESLALQAKIAALQKKIAARNLQIATLEAQITQARLDLIAERVESIRLRGLNADLYFSVAEAFQELARRHLDAAIRWAYLYERAAAFSKFRTGIETIAFDYLDRDARDGNAQPLARLLTAPDRLLADLGAVDLLTIDFDRVVPFVNRYHLAMEFPLEFDDLKKHKKMTFALSLPRLERDRPGHERVGIKYVGVQIFGATASQGWSGDLRHRGSFIVRDAQTTPAPGSGHILPSEAELTAAFDRVAAGAAPEPIGGVIPYWLPKGAFPLNDGMPIPTNTMPDPVPDSLTGLEGYGAAGTWELELRGPNFDASRLTEVIVTISYLSPQQIPALKDKIDVHIADYERTLQGTHERDEIQPFSMRGRFPRELATLAETGVAEIQVGRGDFRDNLMDPRLKTIVARVIDVGGRGVGGIELSLTRSNTVLERSHVTDEDGYSEPADSPLAVLDPPARFDVVGSYRLEVRNRTRLPENGDILLLFYYAFSEP